MGWRATTAAVGMLFTVTSCDDAPIAGQEAVAQGQLLCLYLSSHHGALIDFDKPDVVHWGAIAPWSEAEDNKAKVVRVASRGEDAVGTVLVRGQPLPQGGASEDTYYTVYRAGPTDLRLRREPEAYDPQEVGASYLECGPYEWRY